MSGARIRILPEETANRVAAGEVVERPAAALKELLENSVDAGASRVDVQLAHAGQRLIRVADDGSGMAPDDLLLSLERHATSKIAAVEDLGRVATYGFRGEALPSIAAVSRLRIESRERGQAQGTRLDVEFGRILRVAPCGCPEGTLVEVRDLFQALPARLKFLRSEATELGHCLQVASRLALALPALTVGLRHEGRELLRLAAAPDAGARLREHLGREFFAGLVPVRGAGGGCAVAGFVSRPGAGRPGADYQQLFVNARAVRDPMLAQGIRDACREHFLQQRHGASYFLWLELPPDAVDVNVHPTKREVRFRDPAAVLGVVAAALREALRADRAAAVPASPQARRAATAPQPAAAAAATPERGAGAPPPRPVFSGAAERAVAYAAAAPPQQPLALPERGTVAGALRAEPVAQLFGTYLVCAGADGLVLVDQHAAHERVLYERLLARDPARGAQQLLEPVILEVSPSEETALEALRPVLARLGVELAPSGPRLWRVESLPPELEPAAAAALVRELLAAAAEEGPAAPAEALGHRAAALLACHTAVRANQRLSAAQISALLEDLARTANPGSCPHGRPTCIAIGRDEIERRFKRS